ncbi:MAG: hypothetical protein J6O56_02100 [Bacilli bacterium]|nr:hypothetical protein [Bacilli bacterium]
MENKKNKSKDVNKKDIKNISELNEEKVDEVQELVKPEVEKEKKKDSKFVKEIKNNKFKYLIILLAVILVLGIVIAIVKNFKNDDIKKVSKVLPTKYYTVECLDNNCDGIAAYKGSRVGKSKVVLLNGNGNKVAKYTDVYDSKSKISKTPYLLGDNFFIFKKTSTSTNKVIGYSIANKNGKETFNTDKTLKLLNKKLVLMDDATKGLNSYSIINQKGKTLYQNVNDYESFVDGKIISLELDGRKKIVDEEGNLLLDDYFVATSINDKNGETIYLLVEDSKNNSYNYFDLKDLRIKGDSFQNYTKNGDGTLTISKRENNSTVKYMLDSKGKQTLIGDSKTQSEIANDLRKKIDSKKYNLYLTSIYDKDQKFVFADDLSKKAFGIYNIKNNKFTKIYEYKKDSSNLYSSISKITNENNLNYYQISCSTYNCDKNEFYVYDLENGKSLYKVSDSKLKIQNYYQYENDYKVIKYSYSSTNVDYKGKYVLYGKDNKEIIKSSNNIVVVDRKQLIGYESNSSLILYSAKAKKVLNNDNTLATKITLDKVNYYRYQSKNNTILVNEKGKEVLKIDSNSDIIYSDRVLVYIKDKKAYIFDASSSKTRKYRLKNNEKMNDASGDLISPYRGALFINNSSDNNIKVINSKGNVIKNIKKAEIQSVHKTSDGNVIIITKNDMKKIQTYGLYIAK